MKKGDIVKYKGQKAEILKINWRQLADGWARILIKETGESRLVKVEDLET